MPRNSAMVPMVTARAGSPILVTSSPLRTPPRAPTISAATMASGIDQPAWKVTPNTTELSPTIDPTERSMSPVIMIGVMASAMIRMVVTSSSR